MSDTDEIGYADAMAELGSILDALEEDDLDVDLLASRVERASYLVRVCRDRITGARMGVEQIVATLDTTDDATNGVESDDLDDGA